MNLPWAQWVHIGSHFLPISYCDLGLIFIFFTYCSDPQARPDPIGESEPKPRGRPFNYFIYVLLCFLFQNVVTQIPGPTRMADPNRSPVYSDIFNYLIKTFSLCYFSLGFRFTWKHFQMVGPQHSHFIKYNYNDGILCPFKMIYKTKYLFRVHKISHVQKGNDMHMAGYTLIRHSLLYDSALHDLVFLPVYSKHVHR